jgi:hypothetical protein
MKAKLLMAFALMASCRAFSTVNPRVCSVVTPPTTISAGRTFQHSESSLRPRSRLISLSSSDSSDEKSGDEDVVEAKVGIRKRISSYFRGSEQDDGLTFRERLAKMGLATVLSYGWISNTNAMILVSAAWYAFASKVRKITLCTFNNPSIPEIVATQIFFQ